MMRKKGWYFTWFHSRDTLREREDEPLGFSAEVYEPLFIHRSRRGLHKTVDFLVENVEEYIRSRRDTQSSMRKLTERYKQGLSAEECIKYDKTKDEGIAELEEEIGNLNAWKEHWDFFRPSKKHWKHQGKNRVHHLILTRHFNPLELDIYNTMEHVDHKIKAEVLPDLHLTVSAGAYDFFVELVRKKHQEGAPYSILPQTPSFNIIIPSVIIEALNNYPWDQHKEQIQKWAKERQEFRSGQSKEHPTLQLGENIPID